MSQTVSPFHVSLLWPGAGLARVERFARRWRLSLSQGSAIACDRPSSPRSDRPLSGCWTWPIISAGKSKRPTFTAKAIANYGRGLRVAGVRSSPRRVRRVMGENRLLAPPSRRAQPREDARRNHRHRQGQ